MNSWRGVVYCTNYDPKNTTREALKKLFLSYGGVTQIEMKDDYSFIYLDDYNDTRKAINKLNGKRCGYDFGPNNPRLIVQWGEPGRVYEPAPISACRNKIRRNTLLVTSLNGPLLYDDVYKHFNQDAMISQIILDDCYATVQFETVYDATQAMLKSNNRLLTGTKQMLQIQYAIHNLMKPDNVDNPDHARYIPELDNDDDPFVT